MRFDGTMSAKRRQETIARFSIPVQEDDSLPTSTQDVLISTQNTRTRKRTTRSSAKIVIDGGVDDDKDSDFVVNNDNDDDDDFIVDDRDRKPAKKGKGKRKAAITISDLDPPVYSADGVNPRVMLISLKAGALGLNLTVANNVYL